MNRTPPDGANGDPSRPVPPKAPPPTAPLMQPRQVTRFNKRGIFALSAGLLATISAAFVYSTLSPRDSGAKQDDSKIRVTRTGTPQALAAIGLNYEQPADQPEVIEAAMSPQAGTVPTSTPTAVAEAAPADPEADALRKRLAQEAEAARVSGVFFERQQVAGASAAEDPQAPIDLTGGRPGVPNPNYDLGMTPAGYAGPGYPTPGYGSYPYGDQDLYGDNAPDQNLQDKKVAFLSPNNEIEPYLQKPYLHPLSPYQVNAGTFIPAALITGLNSDTPGDVVAVVTESVYDTASGQFLLIPQGTKAYGRYDSRVAYGQTRAVVGWDRLIFPNGRSIIISRMVGTDGAGQAGLADEVDNHYGKLIAGALISTLISFGGNLAREDADFRDSYYDIGDTVAQESARVGQLINRRNLNVQPTVRVRPAFRLNIMVNRDMILEPYRP
ncbi:MAG: conjugal transfer protein TrbI [Rhodospirillales bacterium]|nr:conjugal transfer protein TrbI [Rhodospirillales bacterium]